MIPDETNLVASNAGVGSVVAGVHGTLVDNHGGKIVHVLRHVNRRVVLFHGVGQHIQGEREINVAIHFLGRRGGVFVTLPKCQNIVTANQIHEPTFNCMQRTTGSLRIWRRFVARWGVLPHFSQW
jgi:hypothetical protein